MEYVYLGASIECDGAEIITRNVRFGSLVNLPDVGQCTKYKCDRNSESTITHELKPLNPLRKRQSHLNFGDCIKGDSIVIYHKKIARLKFEVIDKSGRHNARKTSTNNYTYAEITTTFIGIPQPKDPQQKLPPPKKLLKEVILEAPKQTRE